MNNIRIRFLPLHSYILYNDNRIGMTDFVQLCVPNGMLCSSHCLCMGVCINMFLL